MKSMTKLIIVASLILLAALLVNPVAAAQRGATVKDIVTDDHIFVYEKCLNLNPGLHGVGGVVTALRKFQDDDVLKTVLNEISVTNDNCFDVLDGSVGGYTGVYYPVNGVGVKADPDVSISIDRTDLALGVYLTNHIDSLDGKSVTRDTKLAFKIAAS
jgi:hypothetical protein